MADNNRGFANMNEDKQREIARKGGEASSAKQDMSKLGKKGAEAQSHEAKVKGGAHSHSGSHKSNEG
jgi:general stress protein YciG